MRAPLPPCADDPSRRVETVFTQIAATRMHDLPYLNPALEVAAVGFRRWEQSWIGVLVTPWGINLLQLPTHDAPFAPTRADTPVDLVLPGATLSFTQSWLEGLGDYRLCSLFSPAQQFADQTSAVQTAQAVIELLFAAPARPCPPSAGEPDRSRRRLFGLRP